ncbi:MAG: SagB/ThcOx family dehydrogenase [Bacteroidales bacterium]
MKRIFILAFFILMSATIFGQEEILNLPEPQKEGGKPLMEALNERSSARNFSNKEMSLQTLSDMLWAAFGINRPESGKRTAPTSRNVQDMELYITTKNGAYVYLPEEHALKEIVDEDIREFMGSQDFVGSAAVNIVYVSDFSKYDGDDDQQKMATASTHCGFIGQNVYLFAASDDLISVFRAMIDKDKIKKKLNLKGDRHVIYSQSVGYPTN